MTVRESSIVAILKELETVLLETPVPDVRDSQALGPNNAQQFKTYFHDVPGTRPLVSHLVQEGLFPLPLRSLCWHWLWLWQKTTLVLLRRSVHV